VDEPEEAGSSSTKLQVPLSIVREEPFAME